MQSNLQPGEPFHVAIIMDGNGRWGERRGLSRTAGHRAGVEAVRRVVEAAPDLGVSVLTLFAFSSDNWRRPPEEVEGLMNIFRAYLRFETGRLIEAGVRLSIIGRRDRLTRRMREEIARVERITAGGERVHVRLAIDYSGRESIARAAARWSGDEPVEALARLISNTPDAATPDVDLLIRTSGEQRLSDFLLWECAYAELWFTNTLWPDFDGADMAAAVSGFRSRERRFGGVEASRSRTRRYGLRTEASFESVA
ncbi:MAG TPA: di-trans,poly-cis-decaprenylcistransferase [Caulobacteraceae bacterium]|jgi:undecaprenyl diphosphate synthase|nr:di-trans,poly-cis-decaprenylcistransferase [Caulobacteraceae bacterium]